MAEAEEMPSGAGAGDGSKGSHLRGSYSSARRRVERLIAQLDSWTTGMRRALPALDLGWELASRYRSRNGTVLVGHLAYRLFVWLAPLMLVLAAVLGFAASDSFNLIRYASDVGISADAATSAANQAERSRVTALVVGLPALAWATMGLIRGVHYSYAQAWDVELRRRKGLIREVGIAVVAMLALGAIYAVIGAVQRHGPVFALTGWAGSSAVTAVALFLLCWTMPRRTDRWLELVPGPVLAALALSAIHVFVALYLPARIQDSSSLYGAIGFAISVLFYMFLVAYVLVFVALVNSVWVDRREILAGRPWVVDPSALPAWTRRWTDRGSRPTASTSSTADEEGASQLERPE